MKINEKEARVGPFFKKRIVRLSQKRFMKTKYWSFVIFFYRTYPRKVTKGFKNTFSSKNEDKSNNNAKVWTFIALTYFYSRQLWNVNNYSDSKNLNTKYGRNIHPNKYTPRATNVFNGTSSASISFKFNLYKKVYDKNLVLRFKHNPYEHQSSPPFKNALA